MRALAKDPEARPPTALAFAESLVGALGEPLADPAAFQSAEERAAGRRRRTSSGLMLRAPAPQRRAFVKLIAGGALVAALFIGAVVSGQRRARATRPAPAVAASAARAPRPARPPCTVLIESIPSGATVLAEDGTPIGVTPVSWTVAANSERVVTFQKGGFLPMARRFHAASDSTLAVHLDSAPPRPARRAPPRNARGRRAAAEPPAELDSAAGTIDPFAK